MADEIALRLPHNLYLRVLAALEMAETHAQAEFDQVTADQRSEEVLDAYRDRLHEVQATSRIANRTLDRYAVRKFRKKD